MAGRMKYSPIILIYMINGVRQRREYAAFHFVAARERYEALRQCGVRVKVKGWPKRVVVIDQHVAIVPPLEEQS